MQVKEAKRVLGAILAENIIQRGLSQKDLSDITGINQSELSKIARGKLDATLDKLAEFSLALGVFVDVKISRCEPVRLIKKAEQRESCTRDVSTQ